MTDLLDALVKAPLANVMVLAGVAFLLIAVLGKITGEIEAGRAVRIAAGSLGLGMLTTGIIMYARQPGRAEPARQAKTPIGPTGPTLPTRPTKSGRPEGESRSEASAASDSTGSVSPK